MKTFPLIPMINMSDILFDAEQLTLRLRHIIDSAHENLSEEAFELIAQNLEEGIEKLIEEISDHAE